jgi:hypothetical protein
MSSYFRASQHRSLHFFAFGRTNTRFIDMFRKLARALMAETDLFNFAAMR